MFLFIQCYVWVFVSLIMVFLLIDKDWKCLYAFLQSFFGLKKLDFWNLLVHIFYYYWLYICDVKLRISDVITIMVLNVKVKL